MHSFVSNNIAVGKAVMSADNAACCGTLLVNMSCHILIHVH